MDFLKQKGPLAREFCNTLIYIISLVSLKPSSLQRVLTELQWNGMWFFSLAFFAVIFMEMLSDFLLVTDRCTAWKALKRASISSQTVERPVIHGRNAGGIRRRIPVSILPDGYCDGLNC